MPNLQCAKREPHKKHEWTDGSGRTWTCLGDIDFIPTQKKGGW